LDTGAGDIGADEISCGGDLVDLVDVNDPILRQLDIVVGLAQEVPHQILHIAADVTGFAEFGGIALDERHSELGGDKLDDIGLADTGRSIMRTLFLIPPAISSKAACSSCGAADAVEVGTDLCGENRLGLVLLHDILVQVGDQVLRFEIEVDRFFFPVEAPWLGCHRLLGTGS